jgi:tetratricopeptide (TPR) repeat protein
MSTKAIMRVMVLSLVAGATAFGQDVGADVGAGAGIFRAKNPETKKSAKPTTGTKPPSRTTGPARPTRSNVAERVEELLDKGNEARDARRFTEAEDSYKEVLKLTPRDNRAAYGLGNIYSDQQRWAEAEAAYRNSVTWAPTNADAYIALSVVQCEAIRRCRVVCSQVSTDRPEERGGLGSSWRGSAGTRSGKQ